VVLPNLKSEWSFHRLGGERSILLSYGRIALTVCHMSLALSIEV